MKTIFARMNRWLRSPVGVALAGLGGILLVVGVVVGQSAPPAIPKVALSSEALYARGANVKPTLTLALSVEYPTVGAAYVNGANTSLDDTYTPANEYLGYFDPNGCYTYDDTNDYFVRSATTTGHECDGTKFSGNFMNWATTSAIDILRYGLTGGDRITDTQTQTVLQRAVLLTSFFNSTDFPAKLLKKAFVAKAVPNTLKGSHSEGIYIANCLNKIFFGTEKTGNCSTPGNNGNLGRQVVVLNGQTLVLDGDSSIQLRNTARPSTYNSTACASENGSCTLTDARLVAYGANNQYNIKAFAAGTFSCSNAEFGDPLVGKGKDCYVSTAAISPVNDPPTDGFFYSRVQVCDSGDAAARPALCTLQQSGSYKPTGNLQRYSDRMRVAVFGYLKDDDIARYGGVLRAPMKYVGPKQFNSDYKPIAGTNPKAEWDEVTGVFKANPEGATDFAVSGVVNYVNQFGRTSSTPGQYKSHDPVTELYYESLRYLQGLEPTGAATDGMSTAQKDGFPVYNTWTDPHPAITGMSTTGSNTYSCIKNNIITIGDVNTHADKSIPGNDVATNGDVVRAARESRNEPDFKYWTKVVGAFEWGGSVAYTDGKGVSRTTTNPSTRNDANRNLENNIPPCCSDNRYYMAGAAYWANTHDIRPSTLANYDTSKARPGMRVTTYMIDVNEYGTQSAESVFKKNQLYLAAKYGGFFDQSGTGNPFLGDDGRTLDNTNWARSVPTTIAVDGLVAKNYFQGNNAKELLAALDQIFATVIRDAASIAGATASTSRLSTTAAVYQSRFDAYDWSGELVRYRLSVDSAEKVTISTDKETGVTLFASEVLDAIPDASIGNRKIFVGKTTPGQTGTATEFTWDALDVDHKTALKTPPTLTPVDNDATGILRLNYLRGDRSQESTGVMRRRGSRLGDIVNSGVAFSGRPIKIVGDSSYTSFYRNHGNRTSAVFVGANDGMLHAFHADTLAELFAYIPSFVVKNLRDFTLPAYVHRSYVDATPVVAEAKVGGADGSWKTVLVSGAGAGGQGVFALDVSSATAFTAANVMWEFTDRDDPAMGNVVGQPQILRLRTSAPGAATPVYRHFAVVASGVNNYAADGHSSATGKPAIFILDLAKRSTSAWQEGSNYHKIEFPVGDSSKANGIINFTAVRGTAGEVQVLYAGDLQGKLWKLDFRAVGSTGWNFTSLSPLKSGSTPEPLFVATDASGTGQPITVAPEVLFGPNRGYIVAFGTGKFLEPSDVTAPFQVQSYYAVYDNLTAKVPDRGYLKQAAVSSTGIDTGSFTWGVPANADAQGVRAGWYFNYADESGGERQVSGTQMIGSYAVFTSVVPASNGCADGNSHNYIVDVGSGDGIHIASTIGIQGESLIIKVGDDSSTDATSAGRSVRTTRYQIILQGSGGAKVADWTTNIPGAGSSIADGSLEHKMPNRERSWRQIFNYDEIKNRP